MPGGGTGKPSGCDPDPCAISVRSGPPRELPRLCGYLDCFALFDEEGNPDLNASFQLRWLGHAAACGVATGTGFGISDIQLHMGWELQPDGVAVVLIDRKSTRLNSSHLG